MANNSALKLVVDTSEYDANIKRAAEGIQHLAKRVHDAGGFFDYFDKATMDFVKGLEDMSTAAVTSAGQYRELENAYKGLAATYNSLDPFEKQGEAGKELGRQLEMLKERVLDAKANFDAASKSLEMPKVETTKSQLRDLTHELTDLTVAYRALSEEEKASPIGEDMADKIQKLTGEAADMRDAMVDVQASIKNAASDTQKFDQVAGVLQGVTSGFQTVQGAARIMGIQVGDDVKIIADLQAAMAVTSGFQTMQRLLQKQSALMQGVNALQKEFNILANANPYVLLATAAAAVVAAYAAWTSNARDAEKAQKALNGEIEATKTQLSQIDKDIDFSVGVAEAAGKSWKAIHELRLEAARTKLQLADMNYDKLVASGNASAEQIKQAVEMQKQAWDGVMKVLNEGTIHDIQKRNGTGPFATKGGSKEDANFASDSIKAQQKEVEKLSDLWQRASGTVRDDYKKQLDQAQAKLDYMMGKSIDGGQLTEVVITPRIKPVGDTDMGSAMISDLQTSLVNAADNMDISAFTQKFQELLAEGASDIDFSEYFDYMRDALGEAIDEEDWPTIKLAIETGDLDTIKKFQKEVQDTSKKTEDGWKRATGAIGQLGNALNSIEDPTAKILGTVMQGVAGVAAGFGNAAKGPFTSPWEYISFAASGIAAMISAITAIHSATGFANGGIVKAADGAFVPGNNMSGDMVPAMLNSGELILNRAQQGVIAQELEGGAGLENLELDTFIEAEGIRVVLNNNGRRTGRGEYVQSRSRRG